MQLKIPVAEREAVWRLIYKSRLGTSGIRVDEWLSVVVDLRTRVNNFLAIPLHLRAIGSHNFLIKSQCCATPRPYGNAHRRLSCTAARAFLSGRAVLAPSCQVFEGWEVYA